LAIAFLAMLVVVAILKSSPNIQKLISTTAKREG